MDVELKQNARQFILEHATSNFEAIETFMSHHLSELPAAYFEEHFGTPNPSLKTLLEELHAEDWSDEESGDRYVDFRLPGNVSDYVLCVSIDESGSAHSLCMES